MRDKKDEKWEELISGIGAPKEGDEQWEKKAVAALSEEMIADLNTRQKARCPGVIVPNCVRPLNVMDKDGNQVYRIVAYTA